MATGLHRRARSTRLLVASLVVASLMTITLDFGGGNRGPLAALGRASLAIISPLQDGVAAIFRPIGSFFSAIANLGTLRGENERLKVQVAQLERDAVAFQDARRRLEEALELLEIKERLELTTLGAQVVAETPSNFEDVVVIDKGAHDQVAVGLPVIAPEGLVGTVTRVTAASAQVKLIIDPGSRVGVRLARSGEQGVLWGGRGEELRLDLIDPDTEILPRERVVTSGFEGSLFPPGIPVGEVAAARPSDLDLSKEVLIRPNVDFSRLEYVLVVLPTPQQPAPGPPR